MSRFASLQQRLAAAGRVAVLAGGNSAEREISLQSGQAVLAGLRELGLNVDLVDTADLTRKGLQGFDRAFLALHGPGGEDGSIQGYLDYHAIPYTGSGVAASAIAMDKWRCKLLWQGAGLSTPDFYLASQTPRDLGFPVMVKPASEGSSIGMSLAEDELQLNAAIEKATAYDQQVLVERFVSGAEFTVAILGQKVLPAIRLQSANRFYDFNAKYERDDTQYLCPCGLSGEEEKALGELVRQAFDVVGCRHWGRVDVMQDADGRFYLLEVNTIPGMTSHSLVPMAAKAEGMSFAELVGEILAISLEEAQ